MSPQKRIKSLIARRAKLEDAAAKQQLSMLRALRRDIVARLANAGGFQQFRLQQMLSVVDSQVKQYGRLAETDVVARIQSAWKAGDEIASVAVGAEGGLYGVSPELLKSLVDVVSDQTRGIYGELGSRLKTQIRQTTLGVTDPFEAMGKVAKLIKDPKTFKSAFARAETIVRTETNRAFSMATHARQIDANKRMEIAGEKLMKYWLSAEDDRVRPEHAEAARKYSKDSPIPVDEPFIVGDEELMHPQDPAGSAWNCINCRCVELAVVVAVEKSATGSAAAGFVDDGPVAVQDRDWGQGYRIPAA